MSTPPIHTWTDAYLATKRQLEAVRGLVEIHTGTPDALSWPRSTGHDVIAIAAVLDKALRSAPTVYATDGVSWRWRSCLDDLERFAWPDPDGVYAENRSFWSCALAVCVHLDASGWAPPGAVFWEGFLRMFDEHGTDYRNAVAPGPFVSFDGIKTYDDMYIAQWKYLRDLRGSDRMGLPTDLVAGSVLGGGTFAIPRTTNGDVLQLAAYWTHAFADARSVLDDHDAIAAEWNAALIDVEKLAKGAAPNAVYPKNNVIWRVMDSVSSEVSVADKAPTKWDYFVGALEKSIKDLPENLVKEVEWVGGKAKSMLGGAADAIGDAAGKVAKGLFSGISTPLLVGGGALVAFLLLRDGDHEEARHA